MEIAATIAEMLDQSRKFNRFYISQLDPDRVHERYTLEGKLLNSAYWIVGHLVWAEVSLVLIQEGKQDLDLPWLKEFQIGKRDGNFETAPSWPELLGLMRTWHDKCLEFIRTQTPEDLATPTYVAPARWDTVRKKAFYHCIRHESFHTGQLSWIAGVHGGRTP